MDSKDIRNLQEAYFDVYQNLDERVLGQDPENRKEDSKERKSGSKRLPPSSGEKYAKTQSQLISYVDKLTKNNKIIPGMSSEEFDVILEYLLDEGYDLSDYTWDEMYEIYNEAYKGGPEFGMKYSKSKPLSGKKGDRSGYGGDEKFTKPDDKIENPGTTVPPFKKGGYGRIMSNIPHGIGAHRDKTASRITKITGKDPGAPTSQKMAPKEKKKPSLEIIRKKTNEEYDLYDIILAHLLDEGYANTNENALVIMANMSEEWRESIMEGMKALPVGKMDAKTKELKSKFLKSKPGSPEAGKLISRASQITGTRDKQTV